MVVASNVRPGMALRHEGHTYKVIAADYHPGQGKMSGVLHARLRDLDTGTQWEHSFRADLKFDEAALEKRPMEFLYREGGQATFMDPDTFEQVEIDIDMLGPQAELLAPQMRVSVEMLEGRPVSVQFPDVLELAIVDTPPPLHSASDGPWKSAHLENGVSVMVPPFLKIGDRIRLDVQAMKYMDRVKQKG
jgi:elongation factor P